MTYDQPDDPPRRPTFTPHPQQEPWYGKWYGQQQPRPQYQDPYPPQPPPLPYGQQPYPPQAYPPQYYQQPGQMPPGRRGARKSWPRRHKVLTALVGFAGFWVVVIVAVVAASGADHTLSTGQAGTTTTAASPSGTASGKAASGTARIGSTITLAGNSSGEQMAVTVTKVYGYAQPATEFDDPDSGDRLYAVQFRLADTGSIAYSDSPSNGAAAVDAAGQSYQSTLDNAAECESFPGTENIAAGSSGLGCIVFEVPQASVITAVQFTLDSGMGPQTGQWDVGS